MPPEENGERHRTEVIRKVVEIIDHENGHKVETINFILDNGNGNVEELISYNQLLEHLETADRIFAIKLGLSQSLIVQEG